MMHISAPKSRVQLQSDAPQRILVSRTVEFVAFSSFAGILVLYLGLVSLGQWQSDEYDYFGGLRHDVWNAMLRRWWYCPRPVSEFLYGIYGLLADHFKQPLTGCFLGMLWLAFLICACAPAFQGRISRRTALMPQLLVGMGLATAVLSSGPLFQVFYWPAGAVAYLTTLSATLLLFLELLGGAASTSRGRGLLSLCLVAAAWSSEMGAILVMCFGVLQLADVLFRKASGRAVGAGTVLWWLVPATLATPVLLWVILHRLPVPGSGIGLGVGQGAPPSLRAFSAARELVRELVGSSSQTKHALSAIPTLLSRFFIAVGVAAIWPQHNEDSSSELLMRRQLPLLAGALLAACFCTLFATYPQFAFPGSERYETLRRCWILLAFVAMTVLAFQNQRGQMLVRLHLSNLGPGLLLLGVLLPWHISPVVREYRVYSEVLQTKLDNFNSGYQPNSPNMRFVTAPRGGVITPQILPPGTYTRTAPPSENNYAAHILAYFGKEVLAVRDRK